MEKKLFIASNSYDGINTESVVHHIKTSSDCDVFRYNADKMLVGAAAIELMTNQQESVFVVKDEQGRECYVQDIASAWYRRPNYFGPSKEETSLNKALHRQAMVAQEAYFNEIPENRWLNDPL